VLIIQISRGLPHGAERIWQAIPFFPVQAKPIAILEKCHTLKSQEETVNAATPNITEQSRSSWLCNSSLRRETTVRAKMIENSREICYDGVDKRLSNPKRGDNMNNTQLLNGKFAAAKLPEACASRSALLNLFHEEAGKRVIYVSAPAGYGKTISTLLWLENSDYVPIWISLDEYDNTPAIFYKLFCTGIVSVQPENMAMVNLLTSPSFSSSPVEHTISLLSEFVPDGKRYTVVLDSMHLVTDEEIRKSGLLVQKRLPACFVAVIITCNNIAEKYIAVTGEEKCAVITADDLAFSVEEIQKYFSEHGRSVTMEEAAAVHTVTEGWAIAVNAIVTSGEMESGWNSSQVSGSHMKTKIWDRWESKLQNFMLKTSVTDEMMLALAERLTGEGGG